MMKVIEYWVTDGKLDGSEPGESRSSYEGKYWRMMKDFIGDPDVYYIERVTSWYDYHGLVDREYETVWEAEE